MGPFTHLCNCVAPTCAGRILSALSFAWYSASTCCSFNCETRKSTDSVRHVVVTSLDLSAPATSLHKLSDMDRWHTVLAS
jgi:hypothetical protein